jgi:Arc/MetJ-type ribon-helix-helix transcriptional regulator
MQFKLKPEFEKFVADRVRDGHFASPDAVVEDALTRMMQEQASLDDEDIGEFAASEAEIDAGESEELGSFMTRMRQKFNVT